MERISTTSTGSITVASFSVSGVQVTTRSGMRRLFSDSTCGSTPPAVTTE
jgi:hypothetical protein